MDAPPTSSSSNTNNAIMIGWAEERRDSQKQTFQVTVGWNDSTETTTIQLPFIENVDSLASSLWPAGLASAILCQSPAFKQQQQQLNNILEVGAGLGLAGQVLAKTTRASSCILTDKNEESVHLLQETITAANNKNDLLESRHLEWRDLHTENQHSVDIVLGSDVAYYYFLLRPLMNTVRHFIKPTNSLFLVVGQANRECQWNLHDNIRNGCYNPDTDAREEAWNGSTDMRLYHLEMLQWQPQNNEVKKDVDGTVPIAVLMHQTPGLQLGPLTEYDYVAEKEDRDKLTMSF